MSKFNLKKLNEISIKYFNLLWGSLELFTRRSRIVIRSLVDTFSELFLVFVTIVFFGGIGYSIFEKEPIIDGIWWAIVTAFTVGYGAIYPETIGARFVGAFLMTLSIFVIVPLVTARLASKMVAYNRTIEKLESFLNSDEMQEILDMRTVPRKERRQQRKPRKRTVKEKKK